MLQYSVIIVALLGCVLSTVHSQPNPDICIPGPVPATNMTKPTLPDQFITHVEWKSGGGQFTMQIKELYDGKNNRGAAVFLQDGTTTHHSYDYKHSQHIEITDGICSVSKLPDSKFNLFGFHYEDGEGHIDSVANIFDFGNSYNDTYIGPDTVRGIPVDHWCGCVYNESKYMTMKLEFYFSEDGYRTPSGDNQVLVRMIVNGTVQNTTGDGEPIPDAFQPFYNMYDYYSFESGPAESEMDYQAPLGYLCPGRNSTSPMPTLPKQFSSSREHVRKDLKKVHFYRDHYDFDAKLVRFFMVPNNDTSVTGGHWDPYNGDPVEVIHDYNTGIGYLLDPINGNCSMGPIWKYGYDAKSQAGGNISMNNVTSYFYLDDAKWVYEGMANVRDIQCHAWIAKRTDYPKHAIEQGYEVNSTWEYFFTDLEWTSDGNKMDSEKGTPVRLEIRATWMRNGTVNNTHDIVNIYHFKKEDNVPLYMFDIQACYKSKETKMLAFMLNGTNVYNTLILNNTRQFHTNVRNSIAASARVSALRVVDVYADDVKGHVKVWFTLLDKPHITGDVSGVLPQNNLTVAYRNLMSAIDNGTMAVNVTYMGKVHTLKVKSKSLVEDGDNPQPPAPPADIVNNGYSAGAMVGLAIAMILVGGVLGLGIGFYLWKHNKGFSYQVQE
ncbi:uncharacterized protein LOC144453549 isoform X2 [Glandiceps talaboti]